MPARGVHFALTENDVRQLLSQKSNEDRLEYVQLEIEETFFESREADLVETDKAWDAIHRCLTDGTLGGTSGQPLELVVLGGRALYSGGDYIMVLKTPEEVRTVAPLLGAITQKTLRLAYDLIDPKDYGVELDHEDFAYTWENFDELREFWDRAAKQGRSILFTADQ
jgi:Domain of unknown function (DUF1877)